jgi:thioredoxin-dependent peroxiredoxin
MWRVNRGSFFIAGIKEENMKWIILLGIFGALALLLVGQMARAGDVPKVGEVAPDFKLSDQHNKSHTLADYRGKWLVLYFYPKDDTPGCTEEACKFRDDLHKITALGAQVVGVSVDDSSSHADFAKKHGLPFPLLADVDKVVTARYGVLSNFVLVKMAKRYTFLIDPHGKVKKVYDKVETSRHSQEIIDDLKGYIATLKV